MSALVVLACSDTAALAEPPIVEWVAVMYDEFDPEYVELSDSAEHANAVALPLRTEKCDAADTARVGVDRMRIPCGIGK